MSLMTWLLQFVAFSMTSKSTNIQRIPAGVLSVMFFAFVAQAAGIKADFKKVHQCIFCHGKDGLATNPKAPNLIGESAIYIEKQLVTF